MPKKNSPGGCKCCYIPCGGPASICVTVNDGCVSSHVVSDATVTVKKGSTTVGTCTTDASGQCCITISESGPYTVTATKGALSTNTVTINATCGTNTVTLSFPLGSMTSVTVSVGSNCDNGALVGATATFSQGGVTVASCVATTVVLSAAQCTAYGIPVGVSTTITYSAPRHDTATQSQTFFGGCGNTNTSLVVLNMSAGYECACPTCVVPTTLTLTDSYYGTCTLTYNAGTQSWDGSITAAYSGCGLCPAGSITINYSYGFRAGTGCIVSISTMIHGEGAPWFTDCPGGTDGPTIGFFNQTSSSCQPFVATFGGSSHSTFAWCYPPAGVTITITE